MPDTRNPSGSGNEYIFLKKFRFVCRVCASIDTLWYINWSYFAIQNNPSVFTDGKYSFVKSTSLTHTFAGILSKVFLLNSIAIFYFLACMLAVLNTALCHNFHLLPNPCCHPYMLNLILYQQLRDMHLSHLMHVLEKRTVLQRSLNLLQIQLNCSIQICQSVLFDLYFSIENNDTFALEEPV